MASLSSKIGIITRRLHRLTGRLGLVTELFGLFFRIFVLFLEPFFKEIEGFSISAFFLNCTLITERQISLSVNGSESALYQK